MNDMIQTIVLGVISSAIFAGLCKAAMAIYHWARLENPANQSALTPETHTDSNDASSTIFQLLYFFIGFLVLYASISIPPTLIACLSPNHPPLLSDARGFGFLLPSIPIQTDFIQIWSLIATLVIFFLIHLLVSQICFPLFSLSYKLGIKTSEIGVQLITFSLLCVPVTATMIWAFTQRTFPQSCFLAIAAPVLIVFQASSQKTA